MRGDRAAESLAGPLREDEPSGWCWPGRFWGKGLGGFGVGLAGSGGVCWINSSKACSRGGDAEIWCEPRTAHAAAQVLNEEVVPASTTEASGEPGVVHGGWLKMSANFGDGTEKYLLRSEAE